MLFCKIKMDSRFRGNDEQKAVIRGSLQPAALIGGQQFGWKRQHVESTRQQHRLEAFAHLVG